MDGTRQTTECSNNNDVQKLKTSDDLYFDSYAYPDVHLLMLKDTKRTTTYRDVMLENKHLFRGKVVLDVGCGTGILCMFAAQAGAARVIGIDCSNIIDHARKIINENNFDNVVTLIKGKAEEVTLPDGIEKVDVIVSEWMGHALFYESMLNTIIYVRDKWLKKGGMIFPDRAQLFIAGVQNKTHLDNRINFWRNVYGFKMETIRQSAIKEAVIGRVNPDQIVTNACMIKDVDIYRVKEEDLTFTGYFHLQCTKDDDMHGLLLYFDIDFTECDLRTGFSTSPSATYTHWVQTGLYFDDKVLTVKKGEEIFGSCTIIPKERNLDFHVSLEFKGSLSEMKEQMYFYMKDSLSCA